MNLNINKNYLNSLKLAFKKTLVESNFERIVKVELYTNWKIRRLDIRLKLLKIATNFFRIIFKTAETIFPLTISIFYHLFLTN